MSLLKFTPHMLKNQPDQTAYLLNKLVSEGVGGGEGGKLYPTTGQHTDGAMTQKATTDALGLKADSITVGQQLATKVDKVAGKELSDNNFTDEELAKLNGIQAGAEVNVQSDWNQADASADDYIKNKPTIPVVPTNLMTTDTAQTVTGAKTFHNAEIATDNMITLKNNSTSLIRGMAGIEYRQLLKRGSTDVEVGNTHDPLALKGSGTRPKYNSNDLALYSDVPAAQVQSDWDQADSTAVDYIKNKPTIPGPYTLPPATASTLGGIKVGNNLSITSDGTLSATAQPAVLYPGLGQNTDGAMTQKASTDLFNEAAYIGTGSVGTPSPWVGTSDIVNGAVTSSKIDWTSPGFSYAVGDIINISGDIYVSGRLTSSNLSFNVVLPKSIDYVSNLSISCRIYAYADGLVQNHVLIIPSSSKIPELNAFKFSITDFNNDFSGISRPFPVCVNLENPTFTFS